MVNRLIACGSCRTMQPGPGTFVKRGCTDGYRACDDCYYAPSPHEPTCESVVLYSDQVIVSRETLEILIRTGEIVYAGDIHYDRGRLGNKALTEARKALES